MRKFSFNFLKLNPIMTFNKNLIGKNSQLNYKSLIKGQSKSFNSIFLQTKYNFSSNKPSKKN